ncbi:MAG: hypothetical protein ACE14L_11280 [Terriglobales bacterium]
MKSLRSLFGLFVIGAIVYCAWLLVPPYYANFQFEEAMDDAARAASTPPIRTSEQDLRENLVRKARGFGIQIQPEQIQVQRLGGDFLVWGEYTVHVDLPLYPLDLQFQPMSKSKKRSM